MQVPPHLRPAACRPFFIWVGVLRETLSSLERGTYSPSLRLAMNIADIFKRIVEEIFGFEDDDENDK